MSLKFIRDEIFKRSAYSTLVNRLLSILPIGKLVFYTSIWIKNTSLLLGVWSQRAIEYPWVVDQIQSFDREALVLDVGTSESLLSLELASHGFNVVGLDIKDFPFENRRIKFVKKNILDTKLSKNTFDIVFIVSTIEHIGLDSYTQLTKDDDGDIKAMEEIYRIIKPNGIIVMTTPYIGNNTLVVNSIERHYNRSRLENLFLNFDIIKEDYFYPQYLGKRLYWEKKSRKAIDGEQFTHPGIACIIARAR